MAKWSIVEVTHRRRNLSKWRKCGEVTLSQIYIEQDYLKSFKYSKNLQKYEYQEQRAEVEVVGADGSIFVSLFLSDNI